LIAQTMKQHDKEPTRWTSIGWQALLITNRLRCQAQLTQRDEEQNEECEREPAPRRDDEQKRAEQIEYVEKRLRELRAWERKIGGNKN
jgi:hypothetical protein